MRERHYSDNDRQKTKTTITTQYLGFKSLGASHDLVRGSELEVTLICKFYNQTLKLIVILRIHFG
jgi:hypothetical protein